MNLRPFLLCFGLCALAALLPAQTKYETYGKTLWCANDTFFLRFSGYAKLFPETVSAKAQQNNGTDAAPGAWVTIYYDRDSLHLDYKNKIPYGHNYYISLASPKGKTQLKLHFNEKDCSFTQDYMLKNNGMIRFEIPEVYELANIIWLLSPSGDRAKDLNKEGDYYQQVMSHFKPYHNHPIFKSLDFADSISAEKYYSFRENSFAFRFAGPKPSDNKLSFSGPYYYVYGNELADSSLFGQLKKMVEDFSAKSGFRQFYKEHAAFYEAQVKREEQLMPVKSMWTWLESEFPGIAYNAYQVIFSPLISGSHSTQRYTDTWPGSPSGRFSQTVMFVCGPERYDANKQLTEAQKEGALSGIVFTEIDHNYVNPTTDKYRKMVESIFSKREVWTKKGASSDFYGRSSSVFNEYMTHAAFSLYVLEHYSAQDAEAIIAKREALNADLRGFVKFREFNRELIRLRQENKNRKLAELYPLILDWCGKQG